jgi:predicted nucleic acid-binding Zn ribbon protein
MNTYIPWTDEELEFLKANYARLSWEELTSKLRRSKAAILHKAQSLRIFRLKSKTKIFTKKCVICGKLFYAKSSRAKCCSQKCKNKLQYQHRIQNQAYMERYKRLIKERSPLYWKNTKKRIHKIWGDAGYLIKCNDPKVLQSELFVANQVLPKHGFTDIIHARQIAEYFPVDILCKKDGKICLVEVTLAIKKQVKPTLIPFIKFLDARYFVCHVKPDFSLFFIKEVDINKKRFSSCLSEIRKIALRESL